MAKLNSRLIKGITLKHGRKPALPGGERLTPPVYQVRYKRKRLYCCWAGGQAEKGKVNLTPTGELIRNYLEDLPAGSDKGMNVIHLDSHDPESLRETVYSALEAAPAGQKLCFVGDITGRLSGVLSQVFSVTGSVDFSEIKAS